MRDLVASLSLVALLTGCAYEPSDWYGIPKATPEKQHAKYTEDSAHGDALPLVSALHGDNSTRKQGFGK